MQAQSLRQVIDRAVTRDGYIGTSAGSSSSAKLTAGMGILAGAAAVTGLVATALIKRSRR
jgi:fission 1 protein